MPGGSRKRTRSAAEVETPDIQAEPSEKTTRRRQKKGLTASDAHDVDASSHTHIDEPVVEEDETEKRRRLKGKGKAVSPPPVTNEENGAASNGDVKVAQGQRALLGRLARAFTCGVCISIYDNPVSLACGHIFCRSCLEKCFKRELGEDPDEPAEFSINGSTAAGPSNATSPPRRIINLSPEDRLRNLVCPVCRARVHDAPTPIFAFREAADALRRGEADGLLPAEDERRSATPSSPVNAAIDQAKRARQDADATWSGLFPQAGKVVKQRKDLVSRGINDREDGVFRCWNCNWEIEDGVCNHCGTVYDEDVGRETDAESYFENLPAHVNGNLLDDSAIDSDTNTLDDEALEDLDRHAARGRSMRFFDPSINIDDSGAFEEEEGSDDRNFIVGSDEEVSRVLDDSDSDNLEELEAAIARSRRAARHASITIEDSDDEPVVTGAGLAHLAEAENVDEDDEEQPRVLSEDAETESEESEDEHARRKRLKREKKERRRAQRRAAEEAEPEEDAADDEETGDVVDESVEIVRPKSSPPPPRRRRREVPDDSPPRRKKTRIQVSSDDES